MRALKWGVFKGYLRLVMIFVNLGLNRRLEAFLWVLEKLHFFEKIIKLAEEKNKTISQFLIDSSLLDMVK